MPVVLDELDRKLISALRNDGRAPVSKLAQILQVSRATVQARLQRLLDNGVVLGFTVRASPDVDEHAIRAVMMIEISGKSAATIVRRLQGLPELRSLHTTNGAWDLVAEIYAGDLKDFDRVLNQVRMIDGILNSETSILLNSI